MEGTWASISDSVTTLRATSTEILRNTAKGRINVPEVLLQTPAIESS